MRNVVAYYTHQVPKEVFELLAPHVSIIQNEGDVPPTREELIRASKDAHSICWFVTDIIDEAIILSCPNLRILAGFGRGYDNIDVSTATSRNIWVTVAPETALESVADMTWGLILSIARRINRVTTSSAQTSFRIGTQTDTLDIRFIRKPSASLAWESWDRPLLGDLSDLKWIFFIVKPPRLTKL